QNDAVQAPCVFGSPGEHGFGMADCLDAENAQGTGAAEVDGVTADVDGVACVRRDVEGGGPAGPKVIEGWCFAGREPGLIGGADRVLRTGILLCLQPRV